MRKFTCKLLLAVSAFAGASSLSSCNYNSLVEQQQGVDQAWAQVENQYQRRADLIPNLVNTVKGYSTHESETLTKVTEARAKATSITIDADNLNEETLAKFQEAQGELSQALKSLLAVTEAYPDLKANENFMNLQTQLEHETYCHRANEIYGSGEGIQHQHKEIPDDDLCRMVRV